MLRHAPSFYQGKYREILAETLESPDPQGSRWAPGETRYVIGALSFVGRVDDGLVMLRKHRAELDPQGLAAARFFLGIALVRVSRVDEGRRLIAQNLDDWRRGRLGRDPVACFFIYQGIAFYRFFQSRFEKALAAARLAWGAALEAGYHYGQSLASDLRGHCMVRAGQISAGLLALDDSARLCERFGLHAQGHVVKTAQFYYRTAHGLLGESTLPELEALIAGFSPEDNFTLAVAQTELARQLSIRGRLRESEEHLVQAARVILKAGHKRQKAMVLHRLAHNRYYQVRFDEALGYLAEAAAAVDGDDAYYMLQIEGLRLKIARRCGRETAEQQAEVMRLTRLVGAGVGRNVAWRDLGVGQPTLVGDDVLGDLRHKCRLGAATPYADVWCILRSGMLGFLHEILPGASGSRVVCFDLVPKRLTVFDDGDVTFTDKAVSSTLRAIALQIMRSPCTKRELVEAHWGFMYHPMRHDTLVYAMINRLRRALGNASRWLLHDGERYAWAPNVRVFTYEAPVLESGPGRGPGLEIDAEPKASSELNHRQIAILSELERRSVINAQHCVEMFGVSRVSAFRDLNDLKIRGHIQSLGRGRATHYTMVRR